ncbi:MAG: rhodanese-like domain-containing protein [Candidatus Cryptobacteroides sp.]
MKKFSLWASVMAILGGSVASNYKDLSVEEFKKLISQSGVVILDVRTSQEYNEGHIEGSLNIDVNSETFLESVEKEINKNDTLAVYCRSGRRSANACKMLSKAGYKNPFNLSGGYLDWIESK